HSKKPSELICSVARYMSHQGNPDAPREYCLDCRRRACARREPVPRRRRNPPASGAATRDVPERRRPHHAGRLSVPANAGAGGPLAAYAAPAYLRSLQEVAPDRMALQGWSNGGSATLAAMAVGAGRTRANGFRAGLAFYPACGLKNAFDAGYRPYAPVRVFMG